MGAERDELSSTSSSAATTTKNSGYSKSAAAKRSTRNSTDKPSGRRSVDEDIFGSFIFLFRSMKWVKKTQLVRLQGSWTTWSTNQVSSTKSFPRSSSKHLKIGWFWNAFWEMNFFNFYLKRKAEKSNWLHIPDFLRRLLNQIQININSFNNKCLAPYTSPLSLSQLTSQRKNPSSLTVNIQGDYSDTKAAFKVNLIGIMVWFEAVVKLTSCMIC